MSKFLLVNTETNIVENIIILDPNNYTTTFIVNDRGDKLPTFIDTDGSTKVSTTKFLVPEGYAVYLSDIGNIGDSYPLPAPSVNNSTSQQ